MRFAGVFVFALSVTLCSQAPASVLIGFTADPAPAGVVIGATTTTAPGAQVNNEPYAGTFAGNPNQVMLNFSYNDAYLAAPTDVRWRTGTTDSPASMAKEFTVTVNVTNNSSVALDELTFTLDPIAGLIFDTVAPGPTPTSPLTAFTTVGTTVLTFGMKGGAGTVAAAGGVGVFQFALDLADGVNGTTFTLAAQVTPEPASFGLAMVAVGLGAAGIRRRRKSKESPEDTASDA